MRLLLRLRGVTELEVRRGDRADDDPGLVVAAGVELARVGALEVVERGVEVAHLEVNATQVVQDLRHVLQICFRVLSS